MICPKLCPTSQKLCLSTKFPHQEIKWNYGILYSGCAKTFKNTLLCSKEDVAITYRYSYNNDNVNLRKDNDIKQGLERFTNAINENNVYRILLRFLYYIGLVGFPVKLDTNIICTLENDMNKLFESVKKVTAILNTQDTAIICHYAPSMQYDKLNLTRSSGYILK